MLALWSLTFHTNYPTAATSSGTEICADQLTQPTYSFQKATALAVEGVIEGYGGDAGSLGILLVSHISASALFQVVYCVRGSIVLIVKPCNH